MHPTYQNRRHKAEPGIFFPRTKLQKTDSRYAPGKWTSACRMKHNEKCHGIIHRSITGRVIWKLSESNFYEDVPGRYEPPTTTHTGGNGQYSGKQNSQRNGKAKEISSNRHEILFGQIQNKTKLFRHILVKGKRKLGRLRHKTPLDMAPYINDTQICQNNKKKYRKLNRPAKWKQERVCWNYQSRGNPETG